MQDGSAIQKPVETAPLPDAGWSRSIRVVENGVIVPPDSPHMRQRAGVLTSNGTYCPEGAVWRFDKRTTLPPRVTPDPKRRLPGTWLWCGSLFDHFGHFMVENVSRLWALDHVDGVDGLCYIPKRPRRTGGLKDFQADVLRAFGADLPVQIIKDAIEVETLVVPGQGFGLGSLISGTEEMRSAFQRRFGKDIAADGPRRLYLSRSGLGPDVSGIIAEAQIESLLSAEGYEIFRPEDYDIPTQIARMKAAEHIIIADGSAGHLLAFVARPDQTVAYLPRRSFWSEGPIDHIEHFAGRAPIMLNTIRREWHPAKGHGARGMAFVQHDLPAMQSALRAAGMLGARATWPEITNEACVAFLRRLGQGDVFSVV